MCVRELGYVHNTLKLLALAWPFLIVRGVFGILQCEFSSSYYLGGVRIGLTMLRFGMGWDCSDVD